MNAEPNNEQYNRMEIVVEMVTWVTLAIICFYVV
jgi:hypothetical protein